MTLSGDEWRTALAGLQLQLPHHFADGCLLERALTHKSYAHEQQQLDNLHGNERLEFLGDAVLELVVSRILIDRYVDASEGRLSKMRAAIVNTRELAMLARVIDLGPLILMSRGEDQNGGRDKPSILANVYEAVVAAVYLDGGFDAAFALVEQQFDSVIERAGAHGFDRDYKSRLQEFAQKNYGSLPEYVIISAEGPDHFKQFAAKVSIDGVERETGAGSSKKAAEQQAARKTLQTLLDELP